MRGPAYFLLVALAVGAGFWTFRVKYAAQDAFEHLATLRAEQARLETSIRLLRAEIAWAERPERLAALVAAHPELELTPLTGGQFAAWEDLPVAPEETFWARADAAVFLPGGEARE